MYPPCTISPALVARARADQVATLYAHVHLTFGIPRGEPIVSDYLVEGSPLRALRGAHNARLVLEAGFTAVKV